MGQKFGKISNTNSDMDGTVNELSPGFPGEVPKALSDHSSTRVHERVECDLEEDKTVQNRAKIVSNVSKVAANTSGNVEDKPENFKESYLEDTDEDAEDSQDEDGFEAEDDDGDDDAYEFISDDLLTDGPSTEDSSPFLALNMGRYTLHPRLRSLNKCQIDEDKDPVNEHVRAAEALFREDLRLAIQQF